MFVDKKLKVIILDQLEKEVTNGFLLKVLSNQKIEYIIAKGIKKLDSSNRVACKIGSVSEFELLESSSLIKTKILKKANLYKNLENNFENSLMFYKKLISILSLLNDEDCLFFSYYLQAYESLFQVENQNKALTWLYYKFVSLRGYKLNYTHCSVCKKTTNISFINLREGGFLCTTHAENKKMRIEILESFFYLSKTLEYYIKKTNKNENQILFLLVDEFIKNYT